MAILIVLLFALLSALHYKAAPKYIDWNSIRIASELLKAGSAAQGAADVGTIASLPYSAAPGYPLVIALASLAAPAAISGDLSCLVVKERQCKRMGLVRLLIGLQALVSLLSLGIVFLLAFRLSCSKDIAILTVVLFLFSGGLPKFSQSLLPFVHVTFLILVACYFAVISVLEKRAVWAFVAGFFCALAALFYFPLAMVSFFLALILLFAPQVSFRRRGGLALGLLLGACVVLVPFELRNMVLFDQLALTDRGSVQRLAARVAFNAMTMGDRLASLVLWLPNADGPLARLMFSPERFVRLGTGKDSYLAAQEAFYVGALSVAPEKGAFQYLFDRHIGADLSGYLLSLPSLFLRGLWGGSTIAPLGLLFFWRMGARMRTGGELYPFVVVLTVLAGGVLAQALLDGTANPHHFNGQIVFVFCYAIAHVTGGLELPRWFHSARPVT